MSGAEYAIFKRIQQAKHEESKDFALLIRRCPVSAEEPLKINWRRLHVSLSIWERNISRGMNLTPATAPDRRSK